MAEPRWRLLAVRGRDAVLHHEHRVMFARRSIARLVTAVLFFAIQPVGLFAMLVKTNFEGIGIAVSLVLGVGCVWFAANVYDRLQAYHFFYPILSIDTRAGALLDAHHRLVATRPDFEITAIGENARDGLRVRCAEQELTVLQDAGDDLAPVLAELQRLGLTVTT